MSHYKLLSPHTCMLPTLHVFILIFLFPTPTTPSLPTSICPPCFCKHEMITSHNYTMLIYHMTRPSKTPYLHWVTSVQSHYNTLKSNKSQRRRSLLPLNLYHVITKPPSAGGKHHLGTIYHTIYVHEGIVHPFYSTTILVLDKQPHPCNSKPCLYCTLGYL